MIVCCSTQNCQCASTFHAWPRYVSFIYVVYDLYESLPDLHSVRQLTAISLPGGQDWKSENVLFLLRHRVCGIRVETVGGHQFGNPITFNNILQLSGREASRPSCTAGKHFNFNFHNASDSAQVTAHHVNHHVLHLKLMTRLIPNEVLNIMECCGYLGAVCVSNFRVISSTEVVSTSPRLWHCWRYLALVQVLVHFNESSK